LVRILSLCGWEKKQLHGAHKILKQQSISLTRRKHPSLVLMNQCIANEHWLAEKFAITMASLIRRHIKPGRKNTNQWQPQEVAKIL
jgi:hypothetical protein